MSLPDKKMTHAWRIANSRMHDRVENHVRNAQRRKASGNGSRRDAAGRPCRIHRPHRLALDHARETGQPAVLTIDLPYREGLLGLERASHVIILSWLHHAPRTLIVQKPRHAAEPKGVFSLRSPARPNPVGLHIARLVALDIDTGRIDLDAIDLLDGTPVIDIKPYFASTDAFAEATIAGRDGQ